MADKKKKKVVKKTAKKKAVGRPKMVFKVDTIIKLIDSDKVNPSIQNIAKVLGCSTNPLRRFIHEHPEIQEAINLRWECLQDKSYEVWADILDGDDTRAKTDLSKWIMARRNVLFQATDSTEVEAEGIKIVIKRANDK